MNIVKISYPTPLEKVKDIYNDNIDVFVELEDGETYTFVVTTPSNLNWYMENNNQEFIEAGAHDIIVKSLTEENIYEAIKTYAQGDGYWMKLLYLSGLGKGVFDIHKLNELVKKMNL